MASVKRPLKLGFLQRDQIRMRQDHGIGQMTPCQDQQKESWPLGGIRPEWETEHESQGGTWKAVRVDFVFSYIDPATVSKKPQRKGRACPAPVRQCARAGKASKRPLLQPCAR